ncbi:stage V sporulation protein T [Sinanaerobacter sp. ZZT-01]|uniref:stage V sporulation protein T n=1 Tax=Sinanaerobacter sp. ZZT-01 TaxID=3111540 RepID=UPI002D7886C1|nr:stage V sporulation protein T [Sinanaerobacter sp. ZZT-01]WRR92220.1 stage V sporulation protein T [Sinanaerobacter sp. ZZT-01]
MKATGIVRRIDDLGRVVIPKEIRRTMRIREGDPLEIYTDREGEVILKKYSPIGELNEFAGDYAEIASKMLGCTFVVTDTDQIIAVAGAPKKEFLEKRIAQTVETIIHEKTSRLFDQEEKLENITMETSEGSEYQSYMIAPIISQGDAIGSVILMKKEGSIQDAEKKTAEIGAQFLARQMEN